MAATLTGTVSLVTGASRGIGAATAVKLAQLGSDIALNYRSKTLRAEAVAASIRNLGRTALPLQADMTIASELEAMMRTIGQMFGKLDLLILNASGGLEKQKADDYAMALNRTAQLETAKLARELMPRGGRIVFVTSHWAHFYGEKPVLSGYEPVAASKHAGEQALREYVNSVAGKDISLVVVSGDAIEGTITPKLLERKHPGVLERRVEEVGELPTVEIFAEAIARAAADRTIASGETIFVGAV